MDGEAPNRLLAEVRAYKKEKREREFSTSDLASFVKGRHTYPMHYLRGSHSISGKRSLNGIVRFNLSALRRLGKIRRKPKGAFYVWEI